MKTIKLFFLSAAFLFTITSCIDDFTITGNGIAATEGRITSDFSQVLSEGAFDVHITHGDEFEVTLNAESNILPYIETDVNGNNLRIHVRGIHNVNNRLPMKVYITTPYLDGIRQSGSGTFTTDFFEADHFDIAISGSGSVETAVDAISVDAVISGSGILLISGAASDGDFRVSGSGKINAHEMELNHCDASVSGSGNMWLNVERYINASISGSGNIYYYGNPDVEKHISGSGNVFPQH